jgi:RNA-binding protein NOB1
VGTAEAETTDDLVQKVENLEIDDTADSTDVVDPSAEHEENEQLEPLQVELHPLKDEEFSSAQQFPPPQPDTTPSPSLPESESTPKQLYDDPSDEGDDGEGEWITPQNVGIHKSRALDLLPDDEVQGKKGKRKQEQVKEIGAGCVTADFAMQNVLLQMGLDLVSVDGKRIQKVKNYVLRCHACFK